MWRGCQCSSTEGGQPSRLSVRRNVHALFAVDLSLVNLSFLAFHASFALSCANSTAVLSVSMLYAVRLINNGLCHACCRALCRSQRALHSSCSSRKLFIDVGPGKNFAVQVPSLCQVPAKYVRVESAQYTRCRTANTQQVSPHRTIQMRRSTPKWFCQCLIRKTFRLCVQFRNRYKSPSDGALLWGFVPLFGLPGIRWRSQRRARFRSVSVHDPCENAPKGNLPMVLNGRITPKLFVQSFTSRMRCLLLNHRRAQPRHHARRLILPES